MDRNDEGVVWLATTRHTRRTNERERVRTNTKERMCCEERERACNTHLATTRHTRRTNEWPAVAEAVRVETSETESQITRAKKGDQGERGSKEEEERKQTGKGKKANRADCYILPPFRPDSVLRGLSEHGRVCFGQRECVCGIDVFRRDWGRRSSSAREGLHGCSGVEERVRGSSWMF
jgi:hypothetical protein